MCNVDSCALACVLAVGSCLLMQLLLVLLHCHHTFDAACTPSMLDLLSSVVGLAVAAAVVQHYYYCCHQ
jgi:hypothetical protein